MQEKPANELISGDRHGFPLVVIFVIAPFEGDDAVFDRDDTAVGESNPVSITTEILNDTGNGFERRFTVDNPLFRIASLDEIIEVALVS